MFKSEKPLTFVRAEHLTGTSKKTGNPYEICNVTLSDGIESFELPFAPQLVHPLSQLQRGDKVNVFTAVEQRFNKSQTVVVNVLKAS